MKTIEDKHIHNGHRGRMYEKLATFGNEVFHTYELLEMLLYSVVPYKDTNPVSKRLLKAFGDLDGVFSAEKSELMQVEGVGERVADFIIGAAELMAQISAEEESPKIYDDYTALGEYLVEYFGNTDKYSVALLLLDNSMRIISARTVSNGDFGSGTVLAKDFIKLAISENASAAVIAHTHPFGPLHPTPQDFEVNKFVKDELGCVGVLLVEHYVICGSNYVGFMERPQTRVSQHPSLVNFYKSKALTEMGGALYDN